LAEFQNPQQEPGSDRRLLLVFAVTFLLILVAQPLLKKYGPQSSTPPAQTQLAQSQPAAMTPASAVDTPSVVPAGGVTKQATSESETVIENDLYRITFTNRGAQVKSWILKKFDNEAQNGPLDLVNPATSPKYGYPLSLWTYDEGVRNRLSSALYQTSQEGKLTAPGAVTFEYADKELSVRKTFHFDHSYVVGVETSTTYKGSPLSALPAWPAGFGDQITPASYAAGLIDYQYNKNIERLPLKKISGGGTIQGPFHWAGPTDQYFAAVFIPDDPTSASLITLHNLLEDPQDAKRSLPVVGAAVGNLHGPTVERVFVGPKELEVLEKIPVPGVSGADSDLNGLVDFGWWGIIAKPLFLWLKWTYNHIVHNWGWTIVLQTLLISVALLPLRVSQMKSMLKMQRVAPQIKSIQERYKKYSLRDPRKAPMNEEISALYKKEGVNPAGGCLPLIIQMPFLFAYYRMLGTALDLRHAHWLWIHDLSARDPFFLLPILLVVSMLITQRMTPQAGMDPAQQKMMTVMMPLMMGFIFFNLAAGLNLYYGESNLISIAQQAIMNRTALGREMREMAEKRARKKEK
jgi:YidC/Oxa1 family membrane protein insertase